jgi:hypothetical protein
VRDLKFTAAEGLADVDPVGGLPDDFTAVELVYPALPLPWLHPDAGRAVNLLCDDRRVIRGALAL